MGQYDDALAKALTGDGYSELNAVCRGLYSGGGFVGEMQKAHVKAHFRRDPKTGKLVHIPDYDDARHKSELEAEFHKGTKVKITEGKHAGKTGKVTSYSGDKYHEVGVVTDAGERLLLKPEKLESLESKAVEKPAGDDSAIKKELHNTITGIAKGYFGRDVSTEDKGGTTKVTITGDDRSIRAQKLYQIFRDQGYRVGGRDFSSKDDGQFSFEVVQEVHGVDTQPPADKAPDKAPDKAVVDKPEATKTGTDFGKLASNLVQTENKGTPNEVNAAKQKLAELFKVEGVGKGKWQKAELKDGSAYSRPGNHLIVFNDEEGRRKYTFGVAFSQDTDSSGKKTHGVIANLRVQRFAHYPVAIPLWDKTGLSVDQLHEEYNEIYGFMRDKLGFDPDPQQPEVTKDRESMFASDSYGTKAPEKAANKASEKQKVADVLNPPVLPGGEGWTGEKHFDTYYPALKEFFAQAQDTMALGQLKKKAGKIAMDAPKDTQFGSWGAIDHHYDAAREKLKANIIGTSAQQAKRTADARMDRLLRTRDSSGKATPRK